MTQVSKFLLLPVVWEKIFDLFIETLLRIKDKKKLNSFVDSFFSPTEKIMLSKRLAIAVLLAKGNDYRAISRIIRVTDGTISKVSLLMKSDRAGLKTAVGEILKRDSGRIIWEQLVDIIDYKGKGRNWSNVGKSKFSRSKRINELKTGLG